MTSRGRNLEGSSWNTGERSGINISGNINMRVFSTQGEGGTMDMEEITRKD